jgi:hypothetical protein
MLTRISFQGLTRGGPHGVIAKNRLIAKISRTELAEMFVRPAPEPLLQKLLSQGEISQVNFSLFLLLGFK